jgi:hypothetical protein
MAEDQTRATRRTVLRSGLLALGGLAGLVGIAGLAERAKSGPVVAPAANSTLTVYGTGWRLAAPGLRRGDLPKRGDIVSVTGVLHIGPAQEPVGDFFATVVHLDGTPGHGPYSLAQQETHTFRLSGGTILGMGTNLADGENVFAIVGGTGRFSGVTGSYVGRQSPLDIGGDGTAEFTFTFNSGR